MDRQIKCCFCDNVFMAHRDALSIKCSRCGGVNESEVTKLENRLAVLVKYCRVKLDENDWHGVSDAANDIRVIEAQIEVLKR